MNFLAAGLMLLLLKISENIVVLPTLLILVSEMKFIIYNQCQVAYLGDKFSPTA